MKSESIRLAEWDGYQGDDYVDIPWPRVHQMVGNEQIRWIHSQDPTKCQLVLDTDPIEGIHRLYAEFYDDRLRLEYALRFAK